MNKDALIFVAGHRGMVGSAIVRRLKEDGYSRIIVRSRTDLDLMQQSAVNEFFGGVRPQFVFLCAARVGGILANSTYPAEFIRDNLQIQTNVIDAAQRFGVEKLLFLGSSCIYPKYAAQPISEECLLTGALEPTNEWYAVAKIAGIKMCQAYRLQYGFNAISAMPTNLYGPGDNFNLRNSHVIPALIRKFHEAKECAARDVDIWGTGNARREFLHVDDLADACVFLMRRYDDERLINVGCGTDISIAELAELVAKSIGYKGTLRFDHMMPDGTPRKLLDVTRLTQLGWAPRISLEDGLEQTYKWFLDHERSVRE